MNNLIDHIRRSLSLKLSFVIVLLTMSVFIFALSMLYTFSRKKIKDEVVRHAGSALTTATMRANRFMNAVEDATNINAWLIEEQFTSEQMIFGSRRILQYNGHVDGCSVMAAPNALPKYGNGFSVSLTREKDSIIVERDSSNNYVTSPLYRETEQRARACWVNPVAEFDGDSLSAIEPMVSYCRPLYGKNREMLGVLSATVSVLNFPSVITESVPYRDSFYVMVGQDGRFLMCPDSVLLLHKTIFDLAEVSKSPEMIVLGHEMTKGRSGYMEMTINEKAYLVSYTPVPDTQWSMALVCPKSEIFRHYNRLTLIVLPLIVLGLLIILLLSYLIVDLAVRPVNNLVILTKSIAEGDFEEDIPESERTDVVGNLQNSFVKMQHSLKKHVSDVSRLNAETEQRNKELQIARQQAEESIRKKDIFIQNMTHQIRTPLNIILGFAQVMRDIFKTQSNDEMKTILATMRHNSMILSNMVLMLYDSSDTGYSEELHSRKDEVNCNQMMRNCLAVSKKRFPSIPVAFETEVPDTFMIECNSTYLARTILELLHNAVKFSDGKNIKLCVKRAEKAVHIIIEDTGAGIAEDRQTQMFEVFTKLNDLSEGLGLGLPLSKRHIVMMGGDLILDTRYHQGCRLIIELPHKGEA